MVVLGRVIRAAGKEEMGGIIIDRTVADQIC